MLARVAPGEVLSIVQDQILKIAHEKNGGLLTIGMLGTIWSTSSGVTAIIDTLNQAYDIQESRPWWKVRLMAIGLTLALALFIVISFALVLVGPTLAEKVAVWLHMGPAFAWTWKILQWPVVFGLVAFAIAMIYYYAPDAEQEWIWITPGSILATVLWLLISLGFKFYVIHFTSYNATYGAIGGVIVLMLWFYVSALAVLVGAELNAEIEHASPYGKEPGERVPGEKKKIGAVGGACLGRTPGGRRAEASHRHRQLRHRRRPHASGPRAAEPAVQRLDHRRTGSGGNRRARLRQTESAVRPGPPPGARAESRRATSRPRRAKSSREKSNRAAPRWGGSR